MTHREDRRAFFVSAIRAAEGPVVAAARTDAVMKRAGFAVADVTRALLQVERGRLRGSRIAALVGSGDNGGDALYALARLAAEGLGCHALLLQPERAHPRGLAALRRAGGRIWDAATPEQLARTLDRADPDVALDGSVGLGASGPPRPLAALAAEILDARGTPAVAVDLPSGLDPDTGEQHSGALLPRATVTFDLWRRAHLLAPSACGSLVCAPIGIPEPDAAVAPAAEVLHSIGTETVGEMWPVPGATDNKYSTGVVAMRAGSERYPGAAVLSVGGAVAATSAMVRYVGPCREQVLAAHPEVVAHADVDAAGQAQAWVAGPGMGTGPGATAELARILALDLPTVVDADGLTLLADHPATLGRRSAPLVLTPHAGEFARLARTFAPEAGDQLKTDCAAAVRALAAAVAGRGVPVTVLLKGRVTLIDDAVHTFAQDAGSSWAATPGSGDVLSGVVGAILAAQAAGGPLTAVPVPQAVAAAQVVHSLAAEIAARRPGPAGAPITAGDLRAALPAAIARARAVAE